MLVSLEKKNRASALFRTIVKGFNFMTPDLIGYCEIKNGAVEVSKGQGFTGKTIYGVTVVKDRKLDYDLSRCFHSLKEAENYIKGLKS